MGTITVGEPLTIADVVAVARERAQVALSALARERMAASRALVERLVEEGHTVYGITTGVGELAGVRISPAQSAQLQVNIIRSHSAGVGEPLPDEVVRAMMLLRAHALAQGYSGVREQPVALLLALLNRGLHPVIPAQGSVGASGDLAPLAHLALALIGEGEIRSEGGVVPAARALQAAGLEPVTLAPKEGMALINGTQLMTACGALAVHDALELAVCADIAGAMTAEALGAQVEAFDPLIHALRPHPGQQASAGNLRRLLEGSEVLASAPARAKAQDAYALRCMPQVHGACRDAMTYAAQVVEIEINSATDNPLVFAAAQRVISGGNFHGQPVALALDLLAIAASALAGIAERRIERLVNPHLSGLPAFLTRDGGLHSGLMLAQYTAAALVSENKVLSHPSSVDSIPTSANQEDHVSMGAIAARKARAVVGHAQQVLGIELLCAAQALDLRAPLRPAPGTGAARAALRALVPTLAGDRVLAPDLAAVRRLVAEGTVRRSVEAVIGELA
ncbi:MAG: histidine ammonia-lyase [Armatimonadota bacterium]|nr:histidine ammonia-lyase [Armatimonadota bacterium]MDR7451604.1 histidine ammonia-lyase [Armatimonadota bacterium]MDR7467676.1 histidine ammonia-lyase [Armatimonadota bacterium]MDR7492573.1 histidine ammonia-lyase [Armatimonadota bacterium]MDR7499959.1 histidine ammonia-lyase [Armatimonadota bacterium]